MATRIEITQAIIKLLPDESGQDIDEAMKTWYQNLRPQGGFRLTFLGYKMLMLAGVANWSVPIDIKSLNKANLLALDRKLNYPYFLNTQKKSLILFSSKEAMLATLYGDITAWLNGLAIRPQQ